jgi:hypothetical protein
MATNLTRAILLNVGVMMAEGVARRSVFSSTFNYTSQTGNTTQDYVTIDAGQNYSWTTPSAMNPSIFTMLVVSSVVTLSVTPRNGQPFAVQVNRLYITDDDVGSLVITNNSLLQVRAQLQQI